MESWKVKWRREKFNSFSRVQLNYSNVPSCVSYFTCSSENFNWIFKYLKRLEKKLNCLTYLFKELLYLKVFRKSQLKKFYSIFYFFT